MPPLTLPFSATVATESMCRELAERAPWCTFRRIQLAKVVASDWEKRASAVDVPASFVPSSGEPMDLIDARPHSPSVLAEMPKLFEVTTEPFGTVRMERSTPAGAAHAVLTLPPGDAGIGFFRANGYKGVRFVSESFAEWLRSHEAGRWLEFDSATVVSS